MHPIICNNVDKTRLSTSQLLPVRMATSLLNKKAMERRRLGAPAGEP